MNSVNKKNIALIAHNQKQGDLVEWAIYNKQALANHSLFATGDASHILEQALLLPVTRVERGPLGASQEIGSMISEGKIDALVFFLDPMEPLQYDADAKALLRIAMIWNVPMACNRSSADFLITSPLLNADYKRQQPDYQDYENRSLGSDFFYESEAGLLLTI